MNPRTAKRFVAPCAFLAACLLCSAIQAADSAALEPYQIILKRNIFNPDRRPPPPPRSTQPPQERAPDPDSFTLLGALISPKTTVAFFEGSASHFTRSARVGDSLGDHQIVSIDFNGVILKHKEESLSLEVGQTRIKQADELWQTQVDRPSYSSKRSRSDSTPDTASASPQESASDDPNDILQQLMKRRKEQLSQ